jgi:hypothetical protein
MQTHTGLVDDLRIRYAASGTEYGPVILLTSPWPESLFVFRRVWPALARLTILAAGHFAWEEIPDQFAALVSVSVTRAEAGAVQPGQ